ncbi:MAG: ABC transporter ATP-binding protein [Syntrophaceae bacterium]|nr:ABC transporter ATP-binding protein [Syntrophaceae bacterium]
MLEIKDLTCGYDSKFVLKDIDFKIDSGEFLGVIGPNGSGKTTLLRAITRVLKPRKGSIVFCGEDLVRMGFKELARKIAVVSQNFETNLMNVEEFILLGRLPHYEKFQFLETKEDIEIAKKCMNLTDTFRLKDCSLREISGGERQLVLIARALTQEPELLLLDEPTAHLDITHQVGILDLIRRLNKEFNLTVIMVLHDLNLASEYCKRLMLINEGRIHKIGQPEEILNYQVIEEVYKTIVVVKKNPISSRPYMLLVSEEERSKRGNR